jgi:hypothetical protein
MIQGIHIRATFEEPFPFTDEWLEAVYSSVQRNMAVVSADMFVDEDGGVVAFHFGIDSTLGTSEEFVEDVAREALEKAFEDASGDGSFEERPQLISGAVAAFA